MAYWKCKGEFKGFIDIYGEANANLTATTTGKSYTALADSSGYARIKVKKKGDYIISSDRTVRNAHASILNKIPVTAEYTWTKWDAGTAYSYNHSSYNQDVPGSGQHVVVLSNTGYGGAYFSYNGVTGNKHNPSSYLSFNSSNGIFTLVNAQWKGLDNYWTTDGYYTASAGGYGTAFIPQITSTSGTTVIWLEDTAVNGNYGDPRYWQNYGVRIGGAQWGGKYTVHTYSSYGYHYKTEIQRESVYGTTLTAYPSNGVKTSYDGYWYVAS